MVARALILLIRVYQVTLSPLLGPVCRFEPSCSRYAASCLQLHGALQGSWLALRRLARCHPFHPGGFDPPPLPRGHGHDGPPGNPTPIRALASGNEDARTSSREARLEATSAPRA